MKICSFKISKKTYFPLSQQFHKSFLNSFVCNNKPKFQYCRIWISNCWFWFFYASKVIVSGWKTFLFISLFKTSAIYFFCNVWFSFQPWIIIRRPCFIFDRKNWNVFVWPDTKFQWWKFRQPWSLRYIKTISFWGACLHFFFHLLTFWH